MRTPQQDRSSSSTERMLDATLELLGEGGLSAVTVAAVAERAGTSNGSLYHRFRGRSGLLLAAQDRALGWIEQETAAAFRRADDEPDDELAVRLLVEAALGIFRSHHATMRSFLVEARGHAEHDERTVATSHALARLVTGWLRERFDVGVEDAEAAWRILFALGAAESLFDEDQISPTRLTEHDLATSVTRAIRAVVHP